MDVSTAINTSIDTLVIFAPIVAFALFQTVSSRAASRNSCPGHVRRIIMYDVGLPIALDLVPSTNPASFKSTRWYATVSSLQPLRVGILGTESEGFSSTVNRILRIKSMSRFTGKPRKSSALWHFHASASGARPLRRVRTPLMLFGDRSHSAAHSRITGHLERIERFGRSPYSAVKTRIDTKDTKRPTGDLARESQRSSPYRAWIALQSGGSGSGTVIPSPKPRTCV